MDKQAPWWLAFVQEFFAHNPRTKLWLIVGCVIVLVAIGWQVLRRIWRAKAYDDKKGALDAERDHSAETKTADADKARPIVLAIHAFPPRQPNGALPADHTLSLQEYFEGRFIKDPAWWGERIYPALADKCLEIKSLGRPILLRLEAHASIAFACGALLHLKSGVAVEVEQHTDGRVATWMPSVGPDGKALPSMTETEELVGAGGAEIALSLSVTRPVGSHVQSYLEKALPQVGRIVHLTPQGGPGQGMVIDGDHAARLADAVANAITELRGRFGRGRIHLFASCPNAVMLALGRRSQNFGAFRVYEFDFEQKQGGSYSPSFDFDP